MNKTEMLVVGNNQSVLQTVISKINSNTEWNALAATAGEDAIERFHQRNVDLVILLGDIAETAKMKLNKIFRHQSPDLIIIKQNTANIGLLEDTVKASLDKWEKENKPAISFADDAFKNAGLNIIIQ